MSSTIATSSAATWGRAAVSVVVLVAATLAGATGAASAAPAAAQAGGQQAGRAAAQQAPPAVEGVTASPGDGSATVRWTPSPLLSLVRSYTVTASPGGASATVSGLLTDSTVVSGLTNGTRYTFTVVATDLFGTAGPASAPSNAVRPVAAEVLPGQVTGVTASPGISSARVEWTPLPAGEATGYVVTSSPGGITTTVPGAVASTFVTGLRNGTTYTFQVQAVNDVGPGPSSAPSNPVTPNLLPGPDPEPDPSEPTDPGDPGDPGVPTVTGEVTAVAGDGRAAVSWTAPPLAVAQLRGYVVTASPGGRSVTVDGAGTTSAVVDGLDNGTAYAFVVRARGLLTGALGAASPASGSVVPAGLPTAPTTLRVERGDRQLDVTWGGAGANGSPVTAYAVTVGGRTRTVGGSTRRLAVGDLINGRAYAVSVAATNAVGTGEAVSGAVATPAGAPARVSRPRATTSARKVVVRWTPPAGNGDAVEGYRVTVNGAVRRTTRPRITLRNPRPGRYVVRVVARNDVGAGRASKPVRFRVRR